MAVRAPLSVSVVESALRTCYGNMAGAARALGVDRTTIWRFIKKHNELTDVLESMRETMLDNAETALSKAILAGESWAVCFFLKTQGRRRGYSTTGSSTVHPISAEIRQAEADLLTSLGQLLLTPRSRSSARLATDDMAPAIENATPAQAKILKYLA